MRARLACSFLTAAVFGAWSAPSAPAQCGIWDPAIGDPGMPQNVLPIAPIVTCVAVHDDGSGPKLYAGGDFNSFVAYWNGSNWAPLGGGLDWSARCMASFDDGIGPALYVGGLFNRAGGMPIDGIAKWDGANWSPVGTGLSTNGLVLGMTVANV